MLNIIMNRSLRMYLKRLIKFILIIRSMNLYLKWNGNAIESRNNKLVWFIMMILEYIFHSFYQTIIKTKLTLHKIELIFI